jgi:Methyltransferase domain
MVVPPVEYDDDLLRVHLEQAAVRLPGPDYYTVLRWIHEILRPETYIEIGVRRGDSLRAALQQCLCVAVDPVPLDAAVSPKVHVFEMTSDSFFESHNVAEVLGVPCFSLAFIDGLHLFEQALRDFIYLERFASRKSIIMLHDCMPLDRITSDRTRSTHFYSGDVWKLAMCLKTHRRELGVVMVRTAPSGLCLVGHLDSGSRTLAEHYDELVAQYVPMDFDDYQRHPEQMPNSVDNSFEAVSSCINDLLQDSVSAGGPKP